MSILKRAFYYILFFTTVLSFAVNGQQPFFKNYQVRDGLTSNNVYYVFQDSKGYIWFGTDAGILKFDGQNFEKFTTQDGLPDNDVFTLVEDSEGRIWTLNYNGKPGFIKDDILYSEKNIPFLKGIKMPRYLNGFLEDKDGKITITSASSSFTIIDFKNQSAKMLEAPIKGRIMNAWEQSNKKLGFLSDKAIGEVDGGKVTELFNLDVVNILCKSFVVGDSVFISNTRQVFLYNSETKKIEKQYDASDIPTEIISINYYENQLWIGTRKGVYMANEKNKFVPAHFHFLDDKAVSSILKDREGGLWFTTLDAGFFYLPSPNILQYNSDDDLPDDRVVSLKRDFNNNLWIGGNEGKFSILSSNGKIKTHQLKKIYNYNHAIVGFRHYESGRSSINGKLYSQEIINQDTFINLLARSSGLYDKEGNYWFGLNQLMFISKNEIHQWVRPIKELKASRENRLSREMDLNDKVVSSENVSKLIIDNQNRVWVGGINGLHWYKKEKGKVRSFINSRKPVVPHQINFLHYNKNKNLLTAATTDKGIFFIQDTIIINQLPLIEDGKSVFVTKLIHDNKDNIWVGGISGLYKINNDWKTVSNFSYISGIGEEKINALEIVDDHLFIGKDYGLVKIPMRVFETKNEANPPVFLNSMKVNLESIEMEKSIDLSHYQNSISFSFNGLSYQDYGKLQYQYRLIGQNENWISTTSKTMTYKALDPGNYTFEVKAINGQGIESSTPQRLSFHIQKPFWKTGWFLFLCIAVGALGIYFYIKQREKKIKSRYEAQQRLITAENEKLELNQKFQELKMHALQMQMNPHFIFNSLNTIKGYYGAEDVKTANTYIKKFAKLLRVNLDYSNEYIPLNKELEVLKIYVELSQLRYPEKFDLEIIVDKNIHPMEIVIPPMLIQPFVENAIIHGLIPKKEKGQLKISFTLLENELLKVIVEDDGIGREASGKINKNKTHKSLATNITRDRLSIVSDEKTKEGVIIEDLKNEEQKPLGTKTTLLIPVKTLW